MALFSQFSKKFTDQIFYVVRAEFVISSEWENYGPSGPYFYQCDEIWICSA